MRTYTVELSEQQIDVIGRLLGDAPFRVAAPIVHTINQQIMQQQGPLEESRFEGASEATGR
jgi:hypothetical protein